MFGDSGKVRTFALAFGDDPGRERKSSLKLFGQTERGMPVPRRPCGGAWTGTGNGKKK